MYAVAWLGLVAGSLLGACWPWPSDVGQRGRDDWRPDGKVPLPFVGRCVLALVGSVFEGAWTLSLRIENWRTHTSPQELVAFSVNVSTRDYRGKLFEACKIVWANGRTLTAQLSRVKRTGDFVESVRAWCTYCTL